MNDVARLAGVSVKTVSRVANGEPGVHSATARRVRTAIDQLGFHRNVGAHNLRRGTGSGTVGVVTGDTANPFYSTLIRSVEEVARRHDRRVLTGSSAEDPERERELALDFAGRQVDGLLMVPAGLRHGYLMPDIHAGMPVVFLDRPAGDLLADTVLVDNAGGTREAVRHLKRHGHRRIAFFGDRPDIYTADERLRGFREGCLDAGIRLDEKLIVMGAHDQRSIDQALSKAFQGSDPATALVSGNNRITVLALQRMASWLQRPALVGFDDFELADLLAPPVTIIASDVAMLGKAAADLLFARLAGDDSPPRQLTLPVHLIARGSGELRP